MNAFDADDLWNRFSYHAPDNIKRIAHETTRATLHRAAIELSEIIPPGREYALFLTKMEEAMFWANAGIARNPLVQDEE